MWEQGRNGGGGKEEGEDGHPGVFSGCREPAPRVGPKSRREEEGNLATLG